MSFYRERILPRLVDGACAAGQTMKLRSRLVPRARGRVLEVGIGSALNLEFYDPAAVTMVYGLEPSEGMRRRAAERVARAEVPLEWLPGSGESIPLDDASVDTVLLTFTLCTIPEPRAALSEMRRVLAPGGELLFIEHGEAPDARVAGLQRLLNPGWKRLAGGCNLARAMPRLIEEGGFELVELESDYVPKLMKIIGYVHVGRARAAAQR